MLRSRSPWSLHLQQMTNSSDYLTATQLAQRWGVHPTTLARWRQAGKGPVYFRTPGFVLYPMAEVEQYEQANTINPENP
jgi:hypothetical protein